MENPSAAIIIIGNEILSGRTLDTNTQVIALALAEIGISVNETRTIPDIKEDIIETVNQLKSKYYYVFTTGGIGPTHDDITSKSIAEAFGVGLKRDEEIYNLLKEFYKERNEQMNPAREKMAYFPEGCHLIYNKATKIPGFAIQNVFSMAGIPSVMKPMLDSIIPLLKKGTILKTKTLTIMVAESKIADEFENLQNKYPDVDMGSYPFNEEDNQYGTTLVLRSRNDQALDKAYIELEEMLKKYAK